MKLLLDENVSGGVSRALRELGFVVLVAGIDLPPGATDDAVFTFVAKEGAVLITRDHHFTNPVRFDASKTLGVIFLRSGNLSAEQETAVVTAFLKKHSPDEYKGRLVTLYLDSTTIR